MCPCLSGTGGVIASAGNFAAGVDPTELYVGINTANLVNYVTLTNNNVSTFEIIPLIRVTVTQKHCGLRPPIDNAAAESMVSHVVIYNVLK
jgi:hypothetical protein